MMLFAIFPLYPHALCFSIPSFLHFYFFAFAPLTKPNPDPNPNFKLNPNSNNPNRTHFGWSIAAPPQYGSSLSTGSRLKVMVISDESSSTMSHRSFLPSSVSTFWRPPNRMALLLARVRIMVLSKTVSEFIHRQMQKKRKRT